MYTCEFSCRITVCSIYLLLIVLCIPDANSEYEEIPHLEVRNWAWRFGHHLWELSRKITYVDEISEKYGATKVERVDGMKLVSEMVKDIEKLMDWKIQAVQRIADTAEQAVKGHEYEQNIAFPYLDAKSLDESKLPLKENERFNNIRVNVNHSTVHVATNVYDKNPEVLNAIKASSLLDPTFMGNYQHDPTSLWQYFGSSKGFLRHFPGIAWPKDPTLSKEMPGKDPTADTYDCRMRPWYIEAASSPKDIVILMDISGSMKGLRYEIARHVVVNILETLNHNDFVAVFKYSLDCENVVSCFGEKLVPAYRENLELIKDELTKIEDEVANKSDLGLAAEFAFKLLHEYNVSHQGAQCNQAIMIVTDGAPDSNEDVFINFNQPHRQVRIFTYLIGRDVTEDAQMKWMACQHRGYYTHVTNLAEVREQVEKYIPVMARPLAIQQVHNFIWTPVYADIADPKVARWLFEIRERRKRKQRLLRKLHLQQLYGDEVFQTDENELLGVSEEEFHGLEGELWPDEELTLNDKREAFESMEMYELLTTVAVPVFNECNVMTTEKVEINGTLTERTQETKKAELLGVAGTDVPIKQILKLAPPYKIGVNGYPFIITNHGHLISHPDLRPFHKKLLKIGYSSVDISDVEFGLANHQPWERDPEILTLRKNMIDRKKNSTGPMKVKIHYDNKKRVFVRLNKYFFAPINATPFTFGIAIPQPYGSFRVRASTDINKADFNVASLFKNDKKWTIHPDWVYCEYLYAENGQDKTREEELYEHLDHIQNYKREDKMPRVKDPLPWDKKYPVNQKDETRTKNEYYCDRELINNLIFDATMTSAFGKTHSIPTDVQGSNNSGFARRHGVTVTFVATRSGLTRWEDLEEFNTSDPYAHFSQVHNRAIDEVWYKRAVEQYIVNNTSFVFSVPSEAYRKNDTYVTGSHAIFVKSKEGAAPAAVVGLQFKHSLFLDTFINFTSDCQRRHCSRNCSNDDLDCYLLDDNGFVVVSEQYKHTGRFFGDIEGLIMHSLIVDEVYYGVHMYDYQASCNETTESTNSASSFFSPLKAFNWLSKKLFLLWSKYTFYSWFDLSWLTSWATNIDDPTEFHRYMDKVESKHEAMKPCTKQFTLYRVNITRLQLEPVKGKLTKCNLIPCDRHFSVHDVPYTNLILLAVDANCQCDGSKTPGIKPEKIDTNFMTNCQKLKLTQKSGNPQNKCFNYHPDEAKITECGRGCNLKGCLMVLMCSLLTLFVLHKTHYYSYS